MKLASGVALVILALKRGFMILFSRLISEVHSIYYI